MCPKRKDLSFSPFCAILHTKLESIERRWICIDQSILATSTTRLNGIYELELISIPAVSSIAHSMLQF